MPKMRVDTHFAGRLASMFSCKMVRESSAELFFYLQRPGNFKACIPLVCWIWCLILDLYSVTPLMGHLGCLASRWSVPVLLFFFFCGVVSKIKIVE